MSTREEQLAGDLLRQLLGIAEQKEFSTVSEVELLVGSRYELVGDSLVFCLHEVFRGTAFQGATVRVRTVHAGEEFTAPGGRIPIMAHGWDLFVMKIKGRK